ncbi:MAG: hypothetical protein QXL15_01055 [Candidatus Korarchaeota archaeon]
MKNGSSAQLTILDKIAYVISVLFVAPIYAAWVLIGAMLWSPGFASVVGSSLNFLITFIVLVIWPIISIAAMSRLLKCDMDISNREKRIPVFLVATIGYAGGTVYWYFVGNAFIFQATFSFLILNLLLLLFSTRWKISVHGAGIGSVGAFTIAIFGFPATWVLLLSIPVGWARVKLRAHTVAQFIGGFLLGLAVTGTAMLNYILS